MPYKGTTYDRTSVDLARKLLDLVSNGNFEGALDLYADNIRIRDVFGLPVPRAGFTHVSRS